MDKGYEFLTEKEYMWAHLLMRVLAAIVIYGGIMTKPHMAE
jgi:hypothetical protein